MRAGKSDAKDKKEKKAAPATEKATEKAAPATEMAPKKAAPATEKATEATEERRYSKEWYKNRNAYGIRRAFPTDRAQIFTIGGKELIAKEKLEPIALKALDSLSKGVPEEVAKEAALQAYRRLYLN